MSEGTDYDDTNSAIVYSAGWVAQSGTISEQFDNTIHQTSAVGASATIKFSGTRITVYQTVQQGTGTVTVTSDFDGSTSSMSRDPHTDRSYYQDRWFDSGPLTDGVHLLTLTNAGTGPLILDRINVEGTLIGPVRQPIAPTTTTTPSAKPTTTPPTTSPEPTTTSLTMTSTNLRVESTSSTTTSTGTGTTTSSTSGTSTTTGTSSSTQLSPAPVQTVVSVQFVTNSADGGISTITATPSPDSALGHASHALSVGAIIGAAVGCIIFILLLLLLVFCLVRRRRRAARLGDSEKTIGKPRTHTDVSPFRLSSQENHATPADDSAPHSMGLTRKASDNSTTSRRDSVVTSTTPPSSNREQSEKSSELLSPASERTAADRFASFSFPNPNSNNAPHPIPIAETDAGPFRPAYLSGDTLMYGSSSGMYASTTRLIPVDTYDVPPSYQSASHRNSGA